MSTTFIRTRDGRLEAQVGRLPWSRHWTVTVYRFIHGGRMKRQVFERRRIGSRRQALSCARYQLRRLRLA